MHSSGGPIGHGLLHLSGSVSFQPCLGAICCDFMVASFVRNISCRATLSRVSGTVEEWAGYYVKYGSTWRCKLDPFVPMLGHCWEPGTIFPSIAKFGCFPYSWKHVERSL